MSDMNKPLSKRKDEEIMMYLMKPIISALKDAGGQLPRQEIAERIIASDDLIAEYASIVTTSKKSGAQYKGFDFKFNFAIKDLSFVGIVAFEKRNPLITLTEKGRQLDLASLDVKADIIEPSNAEWVKISEENKKKRTAKSQEQMVEEDVDPNDEYYNEYKTNLLAAIANMSPAKFESFSRALLTKMGIDFTSKGISISRDGGIDGYGFYLDKSDFRTSKVVIQCKRFNNSRIQAPEIDKFLGVICKYQADYGVFITNSYFTNGAVETAKHSKPITLIDGDRLAALVAQYEFNIKKYTVIRYELDDYYHEDL